MLDESNNLKAKDRSVKADIACRDLDEIFPAWVTPVESDGEDPESLVVQGYQGEIPPRAFDGPRPGMKPESLVIVFQDAVVPCSVVNRGKRCRDGEIPKKDLPAYVYAPEGVVTHHAPDKGYSNKGKREGFADIAEV